MKNTTDGLIIAHFFQKGKGRRQDIDFLNPSCYCFGVEICFYQYLFR